MEMAAGRRPFNGGRRAAELRSTTGARSGCLRVVARQGLAQVRARVISNRHAATHLDGRGGMRRPSGLQATPVLINTGWGSTLTLPRCSTSSLYRKVLTSRAGRDLSSGSSNHIFDECRQGSGAPVRPGCLMGQSLDGLRASNSSLEHCPFSAKV